MKHYGIAIIVGVAVSCGGEREHKLEVSVSPRSDDAASPSFKIFDGTADGTAKNNSIFMISGLNSSGVITAPIGTSSNILYNRCLLTAGHVVNNPPPGTVLIGWQGETVTMASKAQRVKQKVVRGTSLYNDLAVVWLEARTGADYISTYSQMEMIDDIGLGHVDIAIPPLLGVESSNAPVSIDIYGYGQSTTLGSTCPAGVCTRRYASANARWYSIGNREEPEIDGSVYLLQRVGGKRSCSGDSGGPALHDGKIFSVIKGSTTPDCENAGETITTGLDKNSAAGGESNWDWVHRMAEKYCAKYIGVDRVGPGKVSGTLSPSPMHSYTADMAINGEIKCSISNMQNQSPPTAGWHDCSEAVHDGQSITIEAVPDANAEFVRWEHLAYPESAGCICHLSTSPTCSYSYATIGQYSSSVSLDVSSCRAIFQAKPQWPGPPGPPRP